MKTNLRLFKKSIRKIKVKKSLKTKGFVIFQIDGLSYGAMKRALSLRLMPHLKKMIKKDGYNFEKYFIGVPSDTPFFQAGLLYGDNNNIPGFRWIERKTGDEIIFKKPESAGLIEETLAKKNKGLLTGGSSYVNLFAGGASRSTFTLSTFSIRYLFKRKVRNFDIFIIFTFHIFTFLKTFFYVFFEFLIEIWERVVDVVKKRDVRPEGFFPFSRVMSNVIFKEIETFGAIMDISRGVPSIYLDYIGYDEISHHRGPYSISALSTLRAIDKKIYDIYKEIKKAKRKYDFFIISDHGHTPSIPLMRLHNNKKLKDIIEEYIDNEEISVFEFDTGYNAAIKRLFIYLSDFFKKGKCNEIFNNFTGKVNLTDKDSISDYLKIDWESGKVIYIMNSGPMANIYFSGKSSKLPVEEVEKLYPCLIRLLSDIKGVGFVMGQNETGEVVIFDKNSQIFCGFIDFFEKCPNEYSVLKHIMDDYKSEEGKSAALSSVENYCKFSNVGDLIIFGEYNGSHIINFENQLGAHGGIGGEQNMPFAIWGNEVPLEFGSINNSCQIYDFLYNNYVV